MPPESNFTDLTADPPSGWHSIRPWTTPLSLYVREITSVSATFILATELGREIDSSLAKLGLSAAAEDEDGWSASGDHRVDRPSSSKMVAESSSSGSARSSESSSQAASSSSTSSTSLPKKSSSLIGDILAQGLQVNVNNVNWPRVFIRIDEKVDEAVIIIYGLMPGREYDIDLALVQPGQQSPSIRRHIMTFDENSDPDATAEILTDSDSHSYDRSNSSSSDHARSLSTPSTSPSRTLPSTPPPGQPSSNIISISASNSTSSSTSGSSTPPQMSLEERLNKLRHDLSLINAERDSLLASLKSARRESQKADAAVRAEMEALKRNSEKHASSEARAKQKILALQEQVKRAQASTKETETLVEEIEDEIPALVDQKAAKEEEYKKVKEEADRIRKCRESEVEKEKKRHDAMQAELVTLKHKLEKLSGKKEKQENVTIPDLQAQLKEVEREILEHDRFLEQMDLNREFEIALNAVGQQQQQQQEHNQSSVGGSAQVFSNLLDYQDYPGYIPVQRTRHQSLGALQTQSGGLGPISRPNSIQRPFAANSNSNSNINESSNAALSNQLLQSNSSSSIWSPPLRHTQAHTGRSNSLQYHSHSHNSHSHQVLHNQNQNAQYRDLHLSHSHSQNQQNQQQQQVPVILTNPNRKSAGGVKASVGASANATNPASSSSSSSFNTSSSTTPFGPTFSSTNSIHSSSSLLLPSSTSGGSGSTSTSSFAAASSASTPTFAASSSTLSSRAPAFEPGRGRASAGGGLKVATVGGNVGQGQGQKNDQSMGSPTRTSTANSVGVIGAGRR